MRAVLLSTVGAAVVLAASACGSGPSSRTYPVNVYVDGQHFASVAPGHSKYFLPGKLTVHRGVGIITLHVNNDVANQMVDSALAKHEGRIDLPFAPVKSFIKAPAQQQLYHHDSELTSLSMLLSAVGIDAPQVSLVKQIKSSGPLDPQNHAHGLAHWGDPEQGFVGRYNGAGKAGFGVYEPPIRQLAKKYGVKLVDFQGKSVADVRAALLAGHPIMAWVATAAGPTSTWLTPSGKKITVNLTEQAIVLTGVGPGYYLLNDPVNGKEYKWSLSQFAQRWALLGHRALELP